MSTQHFPHLVASELRRARHRFEPMRSLHEAHSIIREELEEFWELVRMGNKLIDLPDRRERLRKELIQTAAMCQRAAEDLDLVEPQPIGPAQEGHPAEPLTQQMAPEPREVEST